MNKAYCKDCKHYWVDKTLDHDGKYQCLFCWEGSSSFEEPIGSEPSYYCVEKNKNNDCKEYLEVK